MYDFGNTSGHNNYIDFANVSALEGKSTMSLAAWFEMNAVNDGDRHVFAQFAGGDGWSMTFSSDEELGVRHDGTNIDADTVYTVDATPHSLVIRTTSGSGSIVADGSHERDVSGYAPSASSGSTTMRLGTYGQGNGESNAGAACKLGHVMAWDADIGTSGATLFHGGATIPNFADLQFWVKCVGTPSSTEAEIGGAVASSTGTITEHVDAVDDYYSSVSSGPRRSQLRWLIAQYWAPLMAGSGMFGSALKMEERPALLAGIRQAMGCAFYGTSDDHDVLIDLAGRTRPAYGGLA